MLLTIAIVLALAIQGAPAQENRPDKSPEKNPFAGDGSLATETGLRGPTGLAIDAAGNLLVADHDAGHESDGLPNTQRVFKVFGVAAPGLIAGIAFPR